MVSDVIEESRQSGNADILLSANMAELVIDLKEFLFTTVYESQTVQEGFEGAREVIEELYFRFLEDEALFGQEIEETKNNISKERAVCDFIAGMSDRNALDLYKRVFLPRPWVKI